MQRGAFSRQSRRRLRDLGVSGATCSETPKLLGLLPVAGSPYTGLVGQRAPCFLWSELHREHWEMGFLKTLRGWMARGRTFLEMVQTLLPGHSLPSHSLPQQPCRDTQTFPSPLSTAVPPLRGIYPSPHWSSRCRLVSFQSTGASLTCRHVLHLPGPQAATTKCASLLLNC